MSQMTAWQKEFSARSKAGFPIDAIKNDSKFGMEVTLRCHELTWNCGSTNAPDFGEVTITYVPDKLVAETKATKFYLSQYRHRDAYNEELANRILLDFLYYIRPLSVKVSLAQTSRGGIQNTCNVNWNSLDQKDVDTWNKMKYVPKRGFRGGWGMAK